MSNGSKNGGDAYLRVPIPNGRGDEYEFVRVDLSRLSLQVVTQLWSRERSTGGSGDARMRFMPMMGGGLDLTTTAKIEATPANEALREGIENLRSQLHACEKGEAMTPILDKLAGLNEIFDLLASGQPVSAAYTLTSLIWDLLPGLIGVCETLKTAQELAAGMEAFGTHVEQQIEEAQQTATARILRSELALQDYHLKWAAAADEINQTVKQLEEIETRVKNYLTQLRREREEWDQHLTAENSVSGSASNLDVFTFEAHGELSRNDPNVDRLKEMQQMANKAIEELEFAEEMIQEGHQLQLTAFRERVQPMISKVDQLINKLTDGIRRFSEFHHEHGGMTPPYDLHEPVITRAEYDQAVEHAFGKDSIWIPYLARKRLTGDFQACEALLQGQPSLPSEVHLNLRMASGYLTRINESIDAAGRACHHTTGMQTNTHQTILIDLQLDGAPSAADRMEELRELVLCAGYEVTIHPAPRAASRVKALMEVLVYLNRCTDEEVRELYKTLDDSMTGEDEALTVHALKEVSEAVKTTDKTWVRYKDRNFWLIKMSCAGQERVAPLLEQYQLTAEQIRSAFKKRREEKSAKAQKRKCEREKGES